MGQNTNAKAIVAKTRPASADIDSALAYHNMRTGILTRHMYFILIPDL